MEKRPSTQGPPDGGPVCFVCGDTPVRLRFAPDGPPPAEALGAYLMHLKGAGAEGGRG